MGGRREVSILSPRPLTSSDLKLERLFFRESVSTFLQLVVVITSEVLFVYGKLPTYPSPKPTFCPKSEASVNVDLGEG